MNKNWFWLIIGVLAMSSCNKLDVIEGSDPENEVPSVVKEPTATKNISVNLSLGTNFLYKWAEGDSVSLFVMREGENSSEHEENINIPTSYIYGAWNLLSPIKLTDEQWKAYAYFPYRAEWDRYKVPIAVDDSITHMIGATTLSFGYHNNKILIEMKQPKALFTVYVRKQGRVDRKIVKSVRVFRKRSGLPQAGSLDILTGKIEFSKYGDYTKDSLNYEVSYGSTAEPIDFQVLPTIQNTSTVKGAELNNSDPTYIEMEINNGVMTAELPSPVANWEAGKQYIVNVLYNNDELVIEQVSIRVWQTQICEVPGSNLPEDTGL